jgi:N-methylhydantoinase B
VADPIRTEIVRRGVESVAEEMGEALARAAFSPNIKERRDFSCAVFDATGRMVAHAAHIPVHLGAMPASMRAALHRQAAERWHAGDVFALNDPYQGGTHLPDLTLIQPVFHAGTRIGFVAARAHHSDVGGREPGSLSPGRSDALAEGITIPGVFFWQKGAANPDAQDIFIANSRTPDERRGDLAAQHAALLRGSARLQELATRLGVERFATDLDEVIAYARRRLARGLKQALPREDAATFEDALDDDGVSDRPRMIRARLQRQGERLVIDLTASDDEVEGNLNAPRPVTESACLYAVLATIDPDAPANAGAMDILDVRTRKGSLVDPRWPAPVSGGNVETSQRIVDVVLGALARLIPGRVAAMSQGTMNNLMIGLSDAQGGRWTYYETMGGGEGANPHRAGDSGIHTHMTNTQNTPIEALERAYPLRVYATRLRPDTGGPGAHRGGDGIERILGPRGEATAIVSLLGERRRMRPQGIQGGGPGSPGEDHIRRQGKTEWEAVAAKSVHVLKPGDRLRVRSPGGGGWGAPSP